MKKSLVMALSRTAWAMTDRAMKVGIAVLSRDQWFADLRREALQREALEAQEATRLQHTKTVTRRDGVAIVPVVGPLFRRADAFDEMCGGESATYEALRKDFQKALDDPEVHAILLNIDSPGGEVNGCEELAEAIYQARSRKPIVAYVGGMGASAAYWLASAAHEIVAAPTAELGSIGVRSGYLDDSKALERAGFKEWVFVASQSPKKAFDPKIEGDRERLQVVLDDLADVFISRVARNRGVSKEAVMKNYGQGDVMVGDRAVRAGLADRLGDFEAVLGDLISNKGANIMAARPSDGIRASDADNEWKCNGCKEMMGPSATKYCSKCAAPDEDGDDDGDEDEEESKALGLDPKSSGQARRARVLALVEFERKALAATNTHNHQTALEAIAAGLAARAQIAKVEAESQKTKLRALLERGLAGAPGEQPRLSLGVIQKQMATALRGETKKAWLAAMEEVSKAADEAKTPVTVTAQMVLDAACKVSLTAEDFEAIEDFTKDAPPVAAATHIEPKRDVDKENADVDAVLAKIDREADKARATLDRSSKPAAK